MERNNKKFDEMTCYDNCSSVAHPKVINWVCNAEQQFAQRNMNCMARLQQAKKEHAGNDEIGFVGLSMEKNDKFRLYEKYKITHDINYKDVDRWEWLSHKVQKTVRDIKSCSAMGTYWSSTVKTKEAFMKVFNRATRKALELKNGNNDFTVEFHNSIPIDVGVYNETEKTLYIHEWAVQHFRRCDVVLLAFHEILGHHHGAKNHTEKDAMDAEEMVEQAIWTDPIVKEPWSLKQCILEWKLFRLIRAQVDLRLHSPLIKNVYNDNAMTLWNQYELLAKYVVPIEDETIRVAALPVQSQTYF